MRYSYEFKKKCVELYKESIWPETPDGIKKENFRLTVRKWYRIANSCGMEALKPKDSLRKWSSDEKYDLVNRVLDGESLKEVAYSVGIEHSQLAAWVRKYKSLGYNGLVNSNFSKPLKDLNMKKDNKNHSTKLSESEFQELLRLREENNYIKAELAVIKKEIALREEREAAQLKAKKQQLSKNSEKKDTN